MCVHCILRSKEDEKEKIGTNAVEGETKRPKETAKEKHFVQLFDGFLIVSVPSSQDSL